MFQEVAESTLADHFDRDPQTIFIKPRDGDQMLVTADVDINITSKKCNQMSSKKIRKYRVGWVENNGVEVGYQYSYYSIYPLFRL